MTFHHISREGKTYVNKNGIVFTPLEKLGKIRVSYRIDSNTSVELIKPVTELAAGFKGPEQMDYLTISMPFDES